MNTLVTDKPRHPIKANERVVNVVEKAPIASAVYNDQYVHLIYDVRLLTGLPRVLFTVLGTKNGYGFPVGGLDPITVDS